MPIIDKNQSFFNVSPKNARRQKMGEMLIENASKSEPVYGWGQALSKLLAAGVGAYTVDRAERDTEAERNQGYGEIMGTTAADQWTNPDTGRKVGATKEENQTSILNNSDNPYTQQYKILQKVKELDNVEQKLPKEIQILQYLEERNRRNNGGQPQPNNAPSPQANNAPLPQEQIDYATQPTTVGPNGEENLAFPQFGLLDNIDGNSPLPTTANAPRVASNIPGTGGLLNFNNKPSPNLAPPIDQPPAIQPGEQMVGGPNVGRDMNDPVNLFIDNKILGIKPKDRMNMEKGNKQGAMQSLGIQETQGKISQALNQLNTSDFNTGTVGGYMEGVKGSPAYKLAATINSVKANLGFDKLQAMRDSSPTGGALGQVSDRENLLLQQAVANLELAQGYEQLKERLLEVQKHYNNVSQLIAQGQGQEYQAPQSAAPQKPISEMSDQELEAIVNGR
jgi:hypothetical protein